jgi:hypothetical protein
MYLEVQPVEVLAGVVEDFPVEDSVVEAVEAGEKLSLNIV